MKTKYYIWLEPDEIKRLEIKAKEEGFEGKGFVSHYISKVSNSEILFITESIYRAMNKSKKINEIN